MRHKLNIKIALLLGCMLLSAFGEGVSAQSVVTTTVKGNVTDEYGKPLQGVVVNSMNGKNGTSTDVDGNYVIMVDDQSDALVFSYLGYADQVQSLANKEEIDVKMELDVSRSDEIIDMGFTKQKRGAISGAVSSVKGKVLESSPNAKLTPAMNGNVTNLGMWQGGATPSDETFSMLIRGANNPLSGWQSPLIVIDGVVMTMQGSRPLEYITAQEVESITLLKDASTQALYGLKGNTGVLVVTTKKGVKGPIKIDVNYNQSIQQPSITPRIYNSWEYATFRNEVAYNDDPSLGKTSAYSAQDIAKYISGENPELYPNNNWYDMFFKKLNVMSRAGVNISGGNDKFTYFTNVNFVHQGNQYKTTNELYKTSFNTNWFNFRSNVNMKINKYLSSFLRLSGNIRRDRTPNASVSGLYSHLFYRAPNIYGPITPTIYDEDGVTVLDEGGKVIVDEKYQSSLYGMLNRGGFAKSTTVEINAQFGLDLDMSFLTKGLNLGAYMAYRTYGTGTTTASRSYELVKRVLTKPNTLEFETVGTTQDTALVYNKPNGSSYYHLDYRAYLDYNRTFGKHNVQASAFFYYQSMSVALQGSNYVGSSNYVLPFNTALSGFNAAYSYDNRYFVKFDIGYSATEQFAPDYRWIATPAVSAAWNISNEPFMKNAKRWLSDLKIRASYGRTADDVLNNGRAGYLDNYTFSSGGTVGVLSYVTQEGTRGNSILRAQTMLKQNYGIDIGLFNGFTFSFDYFRENMDDFLIRATSNIPQYQGIPLGNYPSTQKGRYENHGYEISANYYKRFNADWSMNVGGWVSYARNKLIYQDESVLSEGYAYRRRSEGFPLGTTFGLLVDYSNGNGFFNTQEELDNYQCSYGGTLKAPRLGDLMYQDLNGDCVIDEKDFAPITNGGIPEVFYAFNAGFRYKSLEFNILFQGVGRYQSAGYNTSYNLGRTYEGIYNPQLENAWTPERYASGAKITSPALSASETSSDQMYNDYYVEDRAFLRLKNVEIAYTLPLKFSKKISADKIRFSLSGQNLVTWSRMKNKDIDPEIGSLHVLPVYRVYNIGVSLLF